MKKRIAAIITAALMTMTARGESPSLSQYCAAKSAVVAEISTGRILGEKNADERLPVASTTKIMTALLTLEHGDLDTPFTVDPDAIRVEGSSMGLKEGDTVTLRALAWGMMLASGNDAANAAAVRIDGTLEKFAERMNRRAKEIGMSDTLFTTPSGLEEGKPYSTARDMAKLACEAMKNKDFAEMAGEEKKKLSYGNPPYDRYLSNHNRLLTLDDRAIGIKTGYTRAAGRCLISAARENDKELLVVTLDCPDDFNVHSKIYDEYFERLEYVDLTFEAGNYRVAVTGAEKSTLPIKTDASFGAFLTSEERGRIRIKFLVEPFIYAPVDVGEQVGEVLLLLGDDVIARAPLFAAEARAAFYNNKSIIERVEEFFHLPELRFFDFPLYNSN